MRSSKKTFTALVALALGSAGFVAGPAAARATAAGPVSLSQAFDNVGITTAPGSALGNLDGTGDSFPAAGLAGDGISPGASLVHDGLTLHWPGAAPGQPDNVVAGGQVIAVRGTGNTLGVAATSTGGSTSGTLTVSYTDGTSTAGTVSVANWVDTSAGPRPAAGSPTCWPRPPAGTPAGRCR